MQVLFRAHVMQMPHGGHKKIHALCVNHDMADWEEEKKKKSLKKS